MNLRDALQSHYDAFGSLTPRAVWQQAEDPSHVLHDRFEWDDSIAGPLYRDHQAAQLIRSVKVVFVEATDTDEEKSTRYWVAPRAPERPHEYEPVAKVAADPMASKLLDRQFEREWKAFKRRWQDYKDFAAAVRADLADSA